MATMQYEKRPIDATVQTDPGDDMSNALQELHEARTALETIDFSRPDACHIADECKTAMAKAMLRIPCIGY